MLRDGLYIAHFPFTACCAGTFLRSRTWRPIREQLRKYFFPSCHVAVDIRTGVAFGCVVGLNPRQRESIARKRWHCKK